MGMQPSLLAMMKTGLPVVARGRASHLLNHRASPTGARAAKSLRHDPCETRGRVYALFDGGWHWLEDGLRSGVVMARRAAPPPPQTVTVGKRVGDVVSELFFTTTEDDAFLVQDSVGLSHGRGAARGGVSR
jgi:hypothetical protein